MGETTSIKDSNKSASSSLFKRNVRKFMNNKLAVLGLVIIVVITIACVIGMIVGVDYGTPVITDMKQATFFWDGHYWTRLVRSCPCRRMLFYPDRCFLCDHEFRDRRHLGRSGRLFRWKSRYGPYSYLRNIPGIPTAGTCYDACGYRK